MENICVTLAKDLVINTSEILNLCTAVVGVKGEASDPNKWKSENLL